MNTSNKFVKPLLWSSTVLLAAVLSACGGSSSGGAAAGPGLGAVGAVCSGASCVNLGAAGKYAILAKTNVSTVPNSVVTGNVAVSPAARTFLTGWSLITEPTDTSFGSAQVSGRLFAADNVGGTTSVNLTTAVGDMGTAYTAAVGLAPAGGGLITACPGAGAFGGLTLAAGVYKCTPAVGIAAATNLTLNGTATDVWVFQMAGGYTQAAATQVILTGGALPQNVFWVSAATVTVGATAVMQGVVLSQTNIVMGAGSTVNGRLLAQTAVTLNQTTVTQP
ncbi:MAG: ice-binding family protein [Gallionella sp.]|nr:ice-binding family protein [Gallionella sp.]